VVYAGVDDCEPNPIYINDSAEEPRFPRTHLTDAQAETLGWQLLHLVGRRKDESGPEGYELG
jgi:hypothetical protein